MDYYNSDNYTPQPTVGRNFQQYINRAYSTAGAIPSTGELEHIINGELNRAYQRKITGENLATQKQQFEKSMEESEKDRVTKSATGMFSTAALLGTDYMLDFPLLKNKYTVPSLSGMGSLYGY